MSILTSEKKPTPGEDWFTDFFKDNSIENKVVLDGIQNLKPVDQNAVRRHLDQVADPVPYLQYLQGGMTPEGGLVI